MSLSRCPVPSPNRYFTMIYAVSTLLSQSLYIVHKSDSKTNFPSESFFVKFSLHELINFYIFPPPLRRGGTTHCLWFYHRRMVIFSSFGSSLSSVTSEEIFCERTFTSWRPSRMQNGDDGNSFHLSHHSLSKLNTTRSMMLVFCHRAKSS